MPQQGQQQQRSVSVIQSFMTQALEQEVLEVACAAFDKHSTYKDVASYMKRAFDHRYPSTGRATDGVYQCLVGADFAASVSHENSSFILLQVGSVHVLLFKSKDSPFDSV